jgi:hypothetical protein
MIEIGKASIAAVRGIRHFQAANLTLRGEKPLAAMRADRAL